MTQMRDQRDDHPDIVTVTVNPSVDLYMRVQALIPGELHRADEQVMVPGGKGLNVSRALARLGQPSVALGFAGGQRGRWLAAQQEGFRAEWIPIPGETRVNVKLLEPAGRLTELNGSAPDIGEEMWRVLTDRLSHALTSGAWLIVGGQLPAGCPADGYRQWIRLAAERGARVALDSSGEAFHVALQARPWFVKPNLRELAEWAGEPISSVREALACARRMADWASLVVVSLGSDGALAVTGEKAWRIRVPNVDAVCPVGAGDSMVAGLVYALTRGMSLEDGLVFAAAMSARKVCMAPGEFPTLEQVLSFVAQVQIETMEG
ncbi:1-phosphofructokinase family hexose kinase [Alicyclobacillus fructus]|uniref:1-phosphofructokinase family hexose kinase n=1 Tax=Alicyclobacillus fructus TaxID=2816082 RepID=UPI001F22C4DB|nr:1-phosphofructokinase family hexose kinase [Alicyclobacillus fructus]